MSYFIDVQGTLIDDIYKKPIFGAIEFIDRLNRLKIPYMLVTNNTKEESEVFYKILKELGFNAPKENYLDPFMVLRNRVTSNDIVAFGSDDFLNTLEKLGFNTKSKNPKAMLISSKKDFSSCDYADMIDMAFNNIEIIGMHATSIYAKDGKRYPGVGAILEMIKYATTKPYTVIGKPNSTFYKEALRLLNLQSNKHHDFKDITMISDDAMGDLRGIKEHGSRAILVLSGKCKSANEIEPIKSYIDDIIEDIGHMRG